MDDKTEAPLIESHREQLINFKKELTAIFEELLAIGLDDKDELFAQHTVLEKLQFGCSHKARQLIGSRKLGPTTTPAVEEKGVKLPKLDVPSFDGDVLNWRQFWEQFSVSVHDRKSLLRNWFTRALLGVLLRVCLDLARITVKQSTL